MPTPRHSRARPQLAHRQDPGLATLAARHANVGLSLPRNTLHETEAAPLTPARTSQRVRTQFRTLSISITGYSPLALSRPPISLLLSPVAHRA
jgi:hypothetical protein